MINCNESKALDTDQAVWEALSAQHEAEMRDYLEQASLEAKHAEYGYYVESTFETGETVLSFEEWLDSQIPDYA